MTLLYRWRWGKFLVLRFFRRHGLNLAWSVTFGFALALALLAGGVI